MLMIVKLIRSGNSLGFHLPRAIIGELKWLPGDRVVLDIIDGQLVVQNLQSHLVAARSRKNAPAKTTQPADGQHK